ncbi:hypothetical protein JRO89_XS05G0102400 [Xanthoceras sorbifolium]|uniref:Uncharacterized protein n=1 Tax=Xanthoceras sorbifolium TaxID=99658 RepID=A0ABQ8I1B2_9ROSI|nr:hypothetical protein JRO89_XS05G0102400 [Xanthoceras sorbifolium]
MFLRPPKNLRDYGSWAVVTGSTDGIGKALAFELAEKGLNLVLVGRNPSKLEATSNEIHETMISDEREVEIRTLVVDMEKSSGEEIARAVEEGIEGLDVGVLVNNAGVAYPYARFFHEVDVELMESVLKVNVDGPTWVTKAVIPVMLKKKKGAIVNIGSGSSVIVPSYPLYAIYAATKAYLAMFSRSIYMEYKEKGIDVQCQIPLFVATKMTKFKRSTFFIPSPKMYSKASIRWIGYEHLCLPYWTHSLQWSLLVFTRDNGVSGLYSKSIDYSGFYFSLQTNPLLLQAAKGLNLVLVGRNPSKLDSTSNEIHQSCNNNHIDIGTLAIDLEKLSGEEIAKAVEEGIAGLDIGILINNAGILYPYARFFHEVDSALMESVLRVNIMEQPGLPRQ